MTRPTPPSLLLLAALAAAPIPARAADGASAGPAAETSAGVTAAPAPSTPDSRARFLAGLEVPVGDPLEALERTAEWRARAAQMAEAWSRMASRLEAMAAWSARELRPRIAPGLPLLYLFGGPDVSTPLALYPDAPLYVLAGLEPVGAVPPPEALAPRAVADGLDALHEALRSVVPSSFFRTHEMGRDLRGHEISGVLPLAYLFIARSGARILDAERIELDPLGFARPLGEDEAWGDGLRGLRVAFAFPGRATQQLVYVKVDLGNEALRAKGGFLRYVERLGPTNALLKAASFILHDNRFSRARDLLLASAVSLLQDDSGAPLRAFARKRWALTPFGTYLVPKEPFERNWQPELDRLFRDARPAPLPFTYGYRHGAAESNLLLAVRADAGAPAAPAPRPTSP
jgi:hypothetical protein